MNRRKPRGDEGATKLTSFFVSSKQRGQNRVVEWEDDSPTPAVRTAATIQPTLSGDVKYTEPELKRTLNAFTVLANSSKRQKLHDAAEKLAEEQAKRKEAEAIERNFYQHLSSRQNRRRERKLDELRDDLETDEELLLSETRNAKRNYVFGRGVVNANLMVIFCKPTNDEMDTKKAFTSGYARVLFDQLRKQGIDPELHCWFTYLMKIAPLRNWDPTYEEVESHLPYLLKEIKIIQPKQIICFGDIPVTLAYAHFRLNKRMIGNMFSEAHRFKPTGLWFIKRLGMAKTAVRFTEFDHIARVFMHSDVKFFMDAKEKINGHKIRQEWLEHFIQLRQQLFLPPLVLSDPIVDLNAHLESKCQGNIYDVAGRLGVHFSQPNEPIIRREQLHAIAKPTNYIEWLGERPFRLYIQTCRFDDRYNRYTLFTRTLEGFSCTLHVEQPVFHFWVYHGSFDRRVNEKHKIDWRPPDEDEIQSQIDDLLTDSLSARFMKKGYTVKEMLVHLGVKVRFVLKRPYQYYHKLRIQFLEVEYKQHFVLHQVKNLLDHLLPGHATYEARVKPTDFLFYERNLTAYGWVQVDKKALTKPPPETISDFEFTTTYNALFPTEGPDAPIRVFNFDGEMKKREGSDKVPEPEDSAIIRLCCTLNDLNPYNRTPLYEIRRHPKAKKDRLRNKKRNQRETRYTGNTNIYQRVEFVVGPHEPPTAEVFTPTVLPYIPLKPIRKLLEWSTKSSTEFVEAWYDWTTFIGQVYTWVTWVGQYRARLLFNNDYICSCFLAGELKTLSKAQYADETIYNTWKDKIEILDVAWETRLPDDAIEEPAYQPPMDMESELEIGNMQYRWKLFYPTPTIRFYDSEAAMLVSFAEYIREADVDLFVGHNICGFDIPFVIRRIHILNLRWVDYFPKRGDWPVALNRCLFTVAYDPTPSLRMDIVRTKKMETRANGARVLTLIDIPGRDTFDTLHYAQRDIADLHGFDLSSVASEVVGDVKHDVPHTSINPLFYNNPKKLTDYCLQDTELCDRIVNYRNALHYVVSTCRLIGPMSIGQFYTSGVQIKNLHRLIRRLRKSGLSKILADVNVHSLGDENLESDFNHNNIYEDPDDCPEEDELDEDEKPKEAPKGKTYQGATVITVKTGFYTDPIPTLDFGSLYPNIMIHKNTCISVMGTKIWLKTQHIPETQMDTSGLKFPDPLNDGALTEYYSIIPRKLTKEEALALPGFDDQLPGLEQCDKNPDNTYTPKLERGDLPAILSELLYERSLAKQKLRGLDSTSEEYKKYDAQQLGLKVIANSVYGATGVVRGALSAVFIGAWVTKFGRECLENVKYLVERHFDAEVLGGDTDSLFLRLPFVKEPSDIYKETEMHSDVKDPTSPLVRKRYIDHLLGAISAIMPENVKMIFEKFYYPIAFEEKKRQVFGILMPRKNPATNKEEFENGNEPRPDEKGTEGKRRSTAPFGARIFRKVYKTFVRGFRDMEKAKADVIALVRGAVDDVINGRIDESELVMTRYYAKTDYSTDKNAVVQLCKLYEQRGEPVPELGTRLKFVVLDAPKGTKFYQKVDDPIHAIQNNLKLDLHYYIENHLRKPIVRLTNVIDKSMDKKMFGELFSVSVNLLDTDPIAKYVTVHKRCEFCRRPCGEDFLCPECRDSMNEQQIEQRLQDLSVQAMEDFEKTKQQCYTCVGVKPGSAIECVNVKCNQFAPRKKAEFRYEATKRFTTKE